MIPLRRAKNEYDIAPTVHIPGGAVGDEAWLRLYAKTRAKQCNQLLATAAKQGYLTIARFVASLGITPPRIKKDRDQAGAIKRMCCEFWWRRQIRKIFRRRIEQMCRSLNLVGGHGGLYVSDTSLRMRQQQKAANLMTLQAMQAVNELGQEFTLSELAALSVSNPVIRRAELMVRMRGFEETAKQRGDVGLFYTITCPSRMHAKHRTGERNEKYDGTTPAEAQIYLSKMWGKVRAFYHHKGLQFYGFRVVEPHHDGTPHWHLLLFMPKLWADTASSALLDAALRADPNEPGAKEHRCKWVEIDPQKGTATGYLAKYVAKNIDAYAVDRVDEDLTGTRDPLEAAARVDAWASLWGIRQFQQIGGHTVGVWRELRRLGEQTGQVLEMARVAADHSCWRDYLGRPRWPRTLATQRQDINLE